MRLLKLFKAQNENNKTDEFHRLTLLFFNNLKNPYLHW